MEILQSTLNELELAYSNQINICREAGQRVRDQMFTDFERLISKCKNAALDRHAQKYNSMQSDEKSSLKTEVKSLLANAQAVINRAFEKNIVEETWTKLDGQMVSQDLGRFYEDVEASIKAVFSRYKLPVDLQYQDNYGNSHPLSWPANRLGWSTEFFKVAAQFLNGVVELNTIHKQITCTQSAIDRTEAEINWNLP